MPRGGGDALGGTVPDRLCITALGVLQIQFCSRPYKGKGYSGPCYSPKVEFSSPFLLALRCPGKGSGEALCVGAQIGILRPCGSGVFSSTPASYRLWGGTYGICCH